jgi:hypothetical protein
VLDPGNDSGNGCTQLMGGFFGHPYPDPVLFGAASGTERNVTEENESGNQQ